MRYLLLVTAWLLMLSCKTKRAENATPATSKTGTSATNHSVALLPFKGIDSTVVLEIRKGIASQLGMQNRKHFLDRMVVLALHELGHTYSLTHCPDNSCLMKDAEGKMNLDDGQTYCQSCRSILLKKGILRSATDQK
jgi:predicted Zn-dependent protease